MNNVGWFLVALGFIAAALSSFIGFAVFSAMAVDLIPFDGPPKPLLYGVFGGYWLMIGGGAIIGIDYLIGFFAATRLDEERVGIRKPKRKWPSRRFGS